MSALHPKASYWIWQGIFDDLRSFEAFEALVNAIPEEKDRGDVFEIFIEGYLATQTIAQCVKYWIVGDIPLSLRERYKLPRDATGIDGIYEAHDGSQVAYQVKYRQKQALTFAEVAPFLGITEQFSDRVIFTNAATLSVKAIVRTRWVSGEVFRALSPEALGVIEAWLKAKPIPVVRAKPDPNYQVQALADIKATFASHDRATVVMACGTGKTLVALWAAEQENPKTVLVLVPSLTLLQQTLLEWSQQTSWGSSFSYICVCSDPTVNLKNDELNTDKSEVGFRVDTDPSIVRQFLERQTKDIKVVFSTYQSAPVVGKSARGLAAFDVAIFDEAHKTIGLAGIAFGYAISDKNIRIKKRLFLTATPRHIDIRHREKEGEFRFYSMDDEEIYGTRAHTLSFGAAAQKGIICRYKVIISLIDKEMVDDFTRRQGITLVEKDEVGARWMANLIAVEQAIERVDAKKIITFHGRVRLAQEFASSEPRGIAHNLRDFEVRHVNGEQRSGDRAEIIKLFKDAPKAILTNARCLTEGINIPAVDMVAFIDPRQSRVDITQAVGRAMRKPRGKTTKTVGYVVVPLFAGMGEKDSIEDAIKDERFDAVVDVLNALQEHDDKLLDIIREIRERKGKGEPFNPRRFSDKLEVIGPRIDLDRLTTSIGIEIADRIGSAWDEWFGLFVRFKTREGHCRIPNKHVEGLFSLGSWVGTQRANRAVLSVEHKQRLDSVGFIWDVLSDQWEQNFNLLKAYASREGHCWISQHHKEDGFPLGSWVSHQRANKDILSEERRQRLNELGFVWDSREASWEEGIANLKAYASREGHCRVPRNQKVNSFPLGVWVATQRENKDILSEERRRRLNELGFVWDPFEDSWEKGIAHLEKFVGREAHCAVPLRHNEDGFQLGVWVSNQRRRKQKISAERQQQLDALGFVWDGLAAQFDAGFSYLKAFIDREGHCRIPKNHKENGFWLMQWVQRQRREKNVLQVERRKQLDEIGFIWDPHGATWDRGFTFLTIYKEREGHCRVPKRHKEQGYHLGAWVRFQRKKMNTLSAERRQRLDKIGFVWRVKSKSCYAKKERHLSRSFNSPLTPLYASLNPFPPTPTAHQVRRCEQP